MGRILIVDDAKFLRMTLRRIIEKTEHIVVGEAKNGEEAVELYRELLPDLVFMDITMPVKSGLAALKEIREAFPDAKVIICSALSQQKMVYEAIKAGAKDFVVKPFEESQILDAIQRIFEKKSMTLKNTQH